MLDMLSKFSTARDAPELPVDRHQVVGVEESAATACVDNQGLEAWLGFPLLCPAFPIQSRRPPGRVLVRITRTNIKPRQLRKLSF